MVSFFTTPTTLLLNGLTMALPDSKSTKGPNIKRNSLLIPYQNIDNDKGSLYYCGLTIIVDFVMNQCLQSELSVSAQHGRCRLGCQIFNQTEKQRLPVCKVNYGIYATCQWVSWCQIPCIQSLHPNPFIIYSCIATDRLSSRKG